MVVYAAMPTLTVSTSMVGTSVPVSLDMHHGAECAWVSPEKIKPSYIVLPTSMQISMSVEQAAIAAMLTLFVPTLMAATLAHAMKGSLEMDSPVQLSRLQHH